MACHCDKNGFGCNQGRDCPERVEFAGSEQISDIWYQITNILAGFCIGVILCLTLAVSAGILF